MLRRPELFEFHDLSSKIKEAVRTTGQPLSLSRLLKWQTLKNYFFLCLFLRKRFLRLCVAILCLFLFLPLGID